MLGREVEVTALGKKWKFGRLDKSVLDEMTVAIREKIGDPFAESTKLITLIEAQHDGPFKETLCEKWKEVYDEDRQLAKQLKAVHPFSEIAQPFLQSLEGCSRMAQLLLKQNHPNIDSQTALNIFLEIGEEKMNEIMELAEGGKKGEKKSTSASMTGTNSSVG